MSITGNVEDPSEEQVIELQRQRIAGLMAQLAEKDKEIERMRRVATCSAEEYEVLRLIQFYARHDPYGQTLIGMFGRLDKIEQSTKPDGETET